MFIICVGLSGKFIIFLLFCYVFDILIFSHNHHFPVLIVLFSQSLEKQQGTDFTVGTQAFLMCIIVM